MIVKVVLFAMAKDLIGANEVEIELEDGATVGDLKRSLVRQYSESMDLVARSAFSVDHEFAVDTQRLSSQSEVALIPPVSGG